MFFVFHFYVPKKYPSDMIWFDMFQMAEHVRYREIDMYDNDADVFARVDEAVTKHPIIVKLSMSGDKPRMAEQDKVIQVGRFSRNIIHFP